MGCSTKQLRGISARTELAAIVRCYSANHRPRKEHELDAFRNEASLRSAVERATAALDSENKQFDHQRRIRRDSKSSAKGALSSILPQLRRCRRFDQLIDLIETSLSEIKGIGPLYVYDTALRIGAKLGLLPDKVYLHSGTRTGAKYLGLRTDVPALRTEDLPRELQGMPLYEVEDILCIYKDNFSSANGVRSAKTSANASRISSGARACGCGPWPSRTG